ncbi:MAG: transporter substrate-binding domain-containing protein [Candidatus Competibacteraceae bacterium]|nr:transporter substrate-binding domain-containing protein [Candidatus Competibacteraceae bacterium]
MEPLLRGLVLLLCLLPGVVRAETITVPIDPYPPWKFVDTERWEVNRGGIDIRLVEVLLAAYNRRYGTDLQASFQAFPWKRCLELMRQGHADLISGILRRPEREEYLIFIEPPYKTHSTKVFYVLKGQGERIRRYEDLYGLTIGVQAGVRYFDRFDQDPRLIREEVSTDLFNFRKLAHGRIDAVISTESQADYLIALHGLQGRFDKAILRHDTELPVYFALSRRSPYAEQAGRFSQVVTELVETEAFSAIIEGFFTQLNREQEENDD